MKLTSRSVLAPAEHAPAKKEGLTPSDPAWDLAVDLLIEEALHILNQLWFAAPAGSLRALQLGAMTNVVNLLRALWGLRYEVGTGRLFVEALGHFPAVARRYSKPIEAASRKAR